MSLFSRIFVYAITLTGISAIHAQQFGGNPPYITWRQINTPAARVIFPAGLDSVATQVAGIVERVNQERMSSIGPLQQKVDIVLQKETTISNGYVGLGPYRSEFYLTPLQNSFVLGSLPWHKQLALHEYRHVQQYNNFNVGVSKVFRVLFGEEGQALANSLSVPDWFFEGDAVFNETQFTRQGRGRLPFFFNGYRSLWEADKKYSWMKLRNGSLRDYTPDHYQLGYLLIAYGREKYGTGFWKNISRDAAAFRGLFYPLQKSIGKNAGTDYQTFRKDALQYFQARLADSNRIENVRPGKHFIDNQEYPAYINDSTVIYTRSSYREVPSFTIRTGSKETRLRVRDVSLDGHFSYRNGKIVYASYRPDTRWGWKDYGELQVLDAATGIQRTLTRQSKYFSPDISEDGSTVLAVEVDPDGKAALHLLDAGTGSLKAEVPNPEKLFYTYPRFYKTGQFVAAVRNLSGQMSLALVDSTNGKAHYCTPFSYQVLGFPFIRGDTVYFTASRGGYDRLFAYLLAEKKIFLLKHPLLEGITGNYQPVASDQKLMWSHFTANGYVLREVDRHSLQWQAMSDEEFRETPVNISLPSLEKGYADLLSASSFAPASIYRKSVRLLNFHSIRPLANDPDYSISIAGENVLNTLQTELFFGYNRNEQFKRLGFETTYGGWYPHLSAGLNYTIDRRSLYRNQRIYWNEWELRTGLSIPFNLSKGRLLTSLRIGADYVFNQPSFKGVFKDSIGNQSFGYLNSFLSFTSQIQKARQHIYPRLGQSITLNYKRSVSNFEASQFLISGSLYFPGLSMAHNLVLTGAFQQRDTLNQRSFSNSFPFSRGYTAESLFRMTKWGINYHFPLCYPDAGFGGIVYLLRLRANLFYDHTRAMDDIRKTADFRSSGTEVFFDTRWWNQLPLSIGFRYSYLLDDDLFGGAGANRFELVLPVNLLQR